MENINAEVFTLRNQRKQINEHIEKLKALLGQFDQLENQLLKSQYKHGIMFGIDEIGLEDFDQKIDDLFEIKQKYHHLWSESQSLYHTMQQHYENEKVLFEDLMNKILNFTPEKVEQIKDTQKRKKEQKENVFKDITNTHKEIEEMENVIKELQGMRDYVSEKSPVAYYNKEVKDFNSVMDKIKSQKKILEDFKKVSNNNMITSTEAVLRTLEQEKTKIVEKTLSAISETIESLEKKIELRKNIANKFLKIRAIRVLVQGLPWSGKFTLIHYLDPFSALQRKGNFSLITAPDFIFGSFKGILAWIQNGDETKGSIITMPEFESKWEEYRDLLKLKIEFTCGTGFTDEELFPKLVEGMDFRGLIFLYDASDKYNQSNSEKLLDQTRKGINVDRTVPELILANKQDITSAKDLSIENAVPISLKDNPEEVKTLITEFLNKIISDSKEYQKILDIKIEE